MASALPHAGAPRGGLGVDKLGVIVAAITLAGLLTQPFALVRANRIVEALGIPPWAALPGAEAWALIALVLLAALVLVGRIPAPIRFASAALALLALAVLVGRAALFLAPPDNPYARVSPGGGFWIMLFGFAVALADAAARMALSPWRRIGLLACGTGVIALLLHWNAWEALSILREYANRADAFWREGRVHILLAFGSLGAAAAAGIPLGVLCFRVPRIRAAILNSLNILQTVPSIALFGLLIAPLAWIGRTVPGAREIGIAGIGVAPAFVALFAYALLPLVSNTVAGLDGVPPDTRDAARGMGMTDGQRLLQVDLPLAFPVILTGVRIVLVQNIGLAVIASLIGGGGFGTFVFQGITQTATDLVLLGALPVVAMAFAAAIILDACVEMTRPVGRGSPGHD